MLTEDGKKRTSGKTAKMNCRTNEMKNKGRLRKKDQKGRKKKKGRKYHLDKRMNIVFEREILLVSKNGK